MYFLTVLACRAPTTVPIGIASDWIVEGLLFLPQPLREVGLQLEKEVGSRRVLIDPKTFPGQGEEEVHKRAAAAVIPSRLAVWVQGPLERWTKGGSGAAIHTEAGLRS